MYLDHLEQLISTKKWWRLRVYIRFHKQAILEQARYSKMLHSQTNLLQILCRFDPPLGAIEAIHSLYPENVFELDHERNSALHIACSKGCNYEVIKYLMELNPFIVDKANYRNRYPFLLIFKNYHERKNEKEDTADNDLLKIAKLLHDVAPLSSIQEDFRGKTALDYAIQNEIGLAPIKYLQKLFSDVRRDIKISEKYMEIQREQLSLEEFGKKKQYVFPEYFHGAVMVHNKNKAPAA